MEQLAFNVHPINRIDHHLWPFSWRHRTECSKYFITGTNPSRPSLRPTVGYFMEQLLVAFLALVLTTLLIPAHVSVLSADTTVNQLNIMLWMKKTGFAPMEFALLKHLRVSWIALSHMKKFLTVRIFLWEAFQQHTCNEWDCLSTEFYVYISINLGLFTTRYNESEKHCVQFSAKHWCVWLISFVAISTCLPIGSFIGTLADPCWAELW